MSPAHPTAPMPVISRMGERHALVSQARLQLQKPAASHALLPAGVAPWLWRSWQRCLMQGRHPAERVEFEAVGPHALHRAQEQ